MKIKRLLLVLFTAALLLFLLISVKNGQKEGSKTAEESIITDNDKSKENEETPPSGEIINNDTDQKDTSVASIPANSNSCITLGEEFIYNGIGCTINSVTVTDDSEDFPERYPEYADKSKWHAGCITHLDWARLYVEAGQGDLHFNQTISFKLIMDITFHNYKGFDDYSLFYQTNYGIYGKFIRDDIEYSEFDFTCRYNSENKESDLKAIHHFTIPAGSDYHAVFIFSASANSIRSENGELTGFSYPFKGEGDIYLIPSPVISRWYDGDRNIPYYYIKDSEIKKDITKEYKEGDYEERRTTYQELLDESEKNENSN